MQESHILKTEVGQMKNGFDWFTLIVLKIM